MHPDGTEPTWPQTGCMMWSLEDTLRLQKQFCLEEWKTRGLQMWTITPDYPPATNKSQSRVCRRGRGLSLRKAFRGIVGDEHVAARGYGCSARTGDSMAKAFFLCGQSNPHQENSSRAGRRLQPPVCCQIHKQTYTLISVKKKSANMFCWFSDIN